MRIIRFVEKANVLIRFLHRRTFTKLEHEFAIGHVHDAHLMADEHLGHIWGLKVKQTNPDVANIIIPRDIDV